jgi:hypothetical protein
MARPKGSTNKKSLINNNKNIMTNDTKKVEVKKEVKKTVEPVVVTPEVTPEVPEAPELAARRKLKLEAQAQAEEATAQK